MNTEELWRAFSRITAESGPIDPVDIDSLIDAVRPLLAERDAAVERAVGAERWSATVRQFADESPSTPITLALLQIDRAMGGTDAQ